MTALLPKLNYRIELPTEFERVLDFVNSVRSEYMLPPIEDLPKGWTHRSRLCIIALAIGSEGGAALIREIKVGTYNSYVGTTAGEKRYEHDEAIAKFVKRFDEGRYPELVQSTPLSYVSDY